MDTKKNVYFKHGQYLFGYDYFSDKLCNQENLISIDKYKYVPLSDAPEAGLVFVERDGKQGVLTLDSCGQGGYGSLIHSSNFFPFLYDEMLLNGNFRGEDIGYIAVRINHNWGILRVEDHMLDKHLRARRPCMMIIPCMYPTKEQDIAKITPSKQYHPEFGWQDPFSEYSQF